MDRLSGLDASFLYLESNQQLMHVCGLILLDPSTIPGGYSFDAMKAELDRRVRPIPMFHRKLKFVPGGIDHPVWVEDHDFDIDRPRPPAALPVTRRRGRALGVLRTPRRHPARPLAPAVGDVGHRGPGQRARSRSSRRCTTPRSTACPART